MDLYFLHSDVHAKRYNCNVLSNEEWHQMGTKHEFMGVFTLVLGIILYLVYLPFLATMLQPRFLHMSCYKLMFFLGVMDFFTITCGNTISGYLLTQGAVFCTHPKLIYFTGSFGIASWCGSCITCMLLTLNRCIDVYFPETARFFYKGWRTWLWTVIPLFVFIWLMLFDPPMCFNSNFMAWFFDPFLGMQDKIGDNGYEYSSWILSTSNVVTSVVLIIGNLILLYYVFSNTGNISSLTNLKRQFVVQVFVICSLVITTSTIYAYMQYFTVPNWLILLSSMSYNFSCGAQPFTYMFLNPSLRNATRDTLYQYWTKERSHPYHSRTQSIALNNSGSWFRIFRTKVHVQAPTDQMTAEQNSTQPQQ